ncbi:tripartite tricarboxylate transporter TctB family protein [Pseudomonas sp. Marseille-QA0892]
MSPSDPGDTLFFTSKTGLESMKDLILGLAFAALGVAVIVMARSFDAIGGMQYGADLFPTLIGFGMVGGGIWLSATSVRQIIRTHANSQAAIPFEFPSLAVVLPVLVVVGYIFVVDLLGTAATLALGMFVLFRVRGVKTLLSASLAVAAAILITLAFTRLLSVPLPLGPLGI